MEPTQCSETSAFNTQTPGKYPEDFLSLQLHGKSLKTRTPTVVSQHVWTPFYTVPLSGVGNILLEPFTLFTTDCSYVFTENIQMEMQTFNFQ
jgi:hypothetical protein